jgi:antitoxin (DNA-binding transcriptional repressor) of toxin-antitoxin stability system
MKSVNIRELLHNFSGYLKEVKSGERITILERHNPVADIIPHNENISFPGWKRKIKRVKLKGESFSKTLLKNRKDER